MKHCARWLVSLVFCLVALSPVDARAQADPSNETLFPILPGLENAVEFWKRIFTEYSTSQLVFLDPLDMSKIYEVQDVGENGRTNQQLNRERARIAAAHGVDVERVRAQRGVKERTAEGLKRSGRYIAQMQQIFHEQGLPVELTYLPIVESSYSLNARSSAGALGMWQFMRVTGKQYMRVNRDIDERKDPLESTRAAALFLKQAYEQLGSWPLAITSYNYGPAGMSRAVVETGSDDLVALIQRYKHRNWGFAPKNFYAEFLAAVQIGKNVNQYFPELQLDPPVALQEIELTQGSSLKALTRSTGLTQDQLLGWNPALSARTGVVPAGYRLKVPVDAKMEPTLEVARNRTPEKPQVIRHRVKPGETLIHIARRYGASVERILQANGLRRKQLVRAGTTLIIPKV